MHAVATFHHEHPDIAKEWYHLSEYMAWLSVKDEICLKKLAYKFKNKGVDFSAFFEPDIGNQLTALTVEPTEKARRMTSHLPLALKELKNIFNYKEK